MDPAAGSRGQVRHKPRCDPECPERLRLQLRSKISSNNDLVDDGRTDADKAQAIDMDPATESNPRRQLHTITDFAIVID